LTGDVSFVAALPSFGGIHIALEAGGTNVLVSDGNRLFRVVVGETAPPPQPVLSVSSTLLDFTSAFGAVTVGTSVDLTFTVQNTGGGTLTGTLSAGEAFTIVSGSSFELTAGQSLTVTVRFSPDGVGAFAGNV